MKTIEINNKKINEMTQKDFEDLWKILPERAGRNGSWNISNLIDNIKSRIEAGHKFIDLSIDQIYSIAYTGSTLTPNSKHYRYFGKSKLRKVIKKLNGQIDNTVKVFNDNKTFLLRVL